MKRIIALLLCIFTLVTMTACGGNDVTDNNSQNDASPPSVGYSDLPFQETYTSMTEEDFNTAVENSLICVYTNGGGDFKYYLDYDLNVLALHCADWRAVAVMDNLEYIDINMPLSEAVLEVFTRMYYTFQPDDWNVPMDIEITCEFGSEGINKIEGPIIDAVVNATNELCIFPQTNFYIG